MGTGRMRTFIAFIAAALALSGVQAMAQVSHGSVPSAAHNVVMPQTRAFSVARGAGEVEITEVRVGVVILEQAATTTMDISLRNPTGSRLEAELIVPVPEGAAVRSFTFEGSAKEATASVLPKDDARETYSAIVAKIRDPALLEFVGYGLIRSSVFPIAPNGTQKVRLTYEHLLPADGGRVDYVLPRSESLQYKVPWHVSVHIKSKRSISTVYSPTHDLETKRENGNAVSVRITDDAATEPGPFRLSYLLGDDGVSASMIAYPDPSVGGGYFLLLAGLPAKVPTDNQAAIKREVTLVLDHSGSMHGEKLEQVREAALQILAGLEEGEAFNVIAYNQTVDLFSPAPVVKTEDNVTRAGAYLKGLKSQGGTNIYDALLEALRQKPVEGMLPIVLFLTDGLPTVGQTSEVAIREMAAKANTYERRVFTLGVGVDVNTPLLDKIAVESRAMSTVVLPEEDVELKVAQVFKRLYGPVLAAPELRIMDAEGKAAMGRTKEILPDKLPDLFDGDQLVLLGKYMGEEPLTFVLGGNYLGKPRTFKFTFGLENATTKNAFVPRLWASRHIAVLIDAIRDLGADSGPATTAQAATDPKLGELVDEIVRLSTEFGILTEYTAFLAREGTDLAQRDEVLQEAQRNFRTRAMATRSGLGSANQLFNNDSQRRQQRLNAQNVFLDQNMNRVTVTNVQQVNDRAFYQRNGQWVDSRLVQREDKIKPDRVVKFGTEEFDVLLKRLAAEGRQGTLSLGKDILLVVDGQVTQLTY